MTNTVAKYKLGGEIGRNVLKNLVPNSEHLKLFNKSDVGSHVTHLVIYGVASTAIVCSQEIISLLGVKKIKVTNLSSGEVDDDPKTFPPSFRIIKTSDYFHRKNSSGNNFNGQSADLTYQTPQNDIEPVTFNKLKKSLNINEVGKGVLNVMCKRFTG